MSRHLQVVVGAALPEPPYPADVRSNGWRFELDMARVKQSATWIKCPQRLRNALLRVWVESWQNSPAGSWPADDELIAAACDIEPELFVAHRAALMRGWYEASDGRLYHSVITELVERMRDGRKSERDKKARQRAAKAGEHPAKPEMSPGTPTGLPRESPGCPPGVPPLEQDQEQDISKTPTVSSHPPGGGKALPEGFAKFWAAWPRSERKHDKAKCAQLWAAKKLGAAVDAIVADVEAKKSTLKWKGGFIEAPLVYLRGRRWEDGTEALEAEGVTDWRESRSGIEDKARKLGLTVWSEAAWVRGEMPEFARWAKRVEKAAMAAEAQTAT